MKEKNGIFFEENNNDINKLQRIIEEQRKIINNLKLEKNKLESILDKKELLINKLNSDIDLMNHKFLSTQECFKIEIKQLNNKFKFEKEGIIKEYEDTIKIVKNENNKKISIENNIKENNKNNFPYNHIFELEQLKINLNKLEDEYNISQKEKNILYETNNKLKRTIEILNNEIKITKKETKYIFGENEILKEIIGNINKDNKKNKIITDSSTAKQVNSSNEI